MKPVAINSAGRGIATLVTGLLLLTAAFGHVPKADAALYWGASGSLGRANLDGSLPLWPLPSGSFPALEPGSVCGLAVDGEHLYWGDSSGGTIGRATLEGNAPDHVFISDLSTPCGVAVSNSHIYWADFDANLIGRASIDGTGVEAGFIAGAAGPCGVAVDAAHVYWSNQDGGSIGRANLDGSNVEQEFVTGLGSPCGIAVSAHGLYWGDQGAHAIGRAGLDGGSVEPFLVPGAGEPWAVAVNATHVYWADRGTSGDPYGGIGRAGLGGGEVNYDLIPGIHFPTGVALDTRGLDPPSPPPPKPSDYLRYGKLTHDKQTGAVKLVVYVPARGEFRVDSPKIGWQIDKGDPPPWVAGSFRWKLKLWPGRGPAGKRIRARLRRTGRAPIELRITYQQEGRLPLPGSKRLAFIRHAGRLSPSS